MPSRLLPDASPLAFPSAMHAFRTSPRHFVRLIGTAAKLFAKFAFVKLRKR